MLKELLAADLLPLMSMFLNKINLLDSYKACFITKSCKTLLTKLKFSKLKHLIIKQALKT